jgi:hypothetical protein
MKNLSDKISVAVSVPSGTTNNKIYPYTVSSKYVDSEIFVGNLFYTTGNTINVDITDLARNYAFNASNYAQPNTNYWRVENSRLMDVYTVSINWGGSTTSGSETVVHVYDYPNKYKADINTNYNNVFFTPSTAAYTGLTNCTMQSLYFDSRSRYRYPTLIPRYPLYEDERDQYNSNIPFYCSVEAGNNVAGLNFHYQEETAAQLDDDFDLQIDTRDGNTLVVYGSMYCFPYPQGWTPETDVTLYLASVNGGEYNKAIAIFEPKYKRYYLQWQDRFGNMQSQPFNCNINYSEDFERQEVLTSDEKRKLVGVTVKPKWSLNSGWISEDKYYVYESLYISPFINLVDTKYDSVISVCITGDYVEKNYHSEKKMLSLNLELEAIQNQEYIY